MPSKQWRNYDPKKFHLIIRELPKTFNELLEAPSISGKISRRTLSNYLKRLMTLGTIRYGIDNRGKRVYEMRGRLDTKIVAENAPISKWVGRNEMRRKGFDLESLYWGGQEFGEKGWWKQVERRREAARAAMTRAEKEWFTKECGNYYKNRKLDAVLKDTISLFLLDWIFVLQFYLTAITGENMYPNTRHELMGSGKGKYDVADSIIGLWYCLDLQTRLWDDTSDPLAKIGIAINAGYYDQKQVRMAFKSFQRWFAKCRYGNIWKKK